MSPVPIYTPGWREVKWSKVPCLRKQSSGLGLNPGPPGVKFVNVNRSATRASTLQKIHWSIGWSTLYKPITNWHSPFFPIADPASLHPVDDSAMILKKHHNNNLLYYYIFNQGGIKLWLISIGDINHLINQAFLKWLIHGCIRIKWKEKNPLKWQRYIKCMKSPRNYQ